MSLLEDVLGHSAEHSRSLLGDAARWEGHRVWLVDGTGLLLADTPANQERWPQSKSQQPGCGFRLIKRRPKSYQLLTRQRRLMPPEW